MIMIVYGYTQAMKSSMVNHDRSEWGTTSLCENLSCSSSKDNVTYLIYIFHLRCYTNPGVFHPYCADWGLV